MKKLLSLILAAIMLLAAMPIAFAEGNTYKVGDIIQFGSYPQSEVKDEALIAELNALAPEWKDWTSYGYYSGVGSLDYTEDVVYGSMEQGDWMRYTDVTYNGNKYRGVKFTQYRPFYTIFNSSVSNTFQYENGYSVNTIFWFKFEPIDWIVLDPNQGFVMCETIIDSQPYSNTVYYNSGASDFNHAFFNDHSYKNYANDYETSSIRYWLNNDFYNIAFTESEKEKINTTTLNNDGYNTSIGNPGYEEFDSNSTNDKIFLLSINEVVNNVSNLEGLVDSLEQASNYAESQGLYDMHLWSVRSPGEYSSQTNSLWLCSGLFESAICESSVGIRPALCFCDIENYNHQHSYNTAVTNPTCTTPGYTTYTCECGDKYFDNFVDERHTFSNKWTIDEEPTCKYEGIKSRHCEFCPARTDITTIGKLAHNFVSVRIEPSCLDDGRIITVCKCGEEIIETIPATGHNIVGSACTECDYDKSFDCSCNCHKSGIPHLIFKILNFFQKLFGKNKICDCGVEH